MRYNTETMLPADAFKKDPLGRIKLHGGGGGGGSTYDPTKDKQYKEQKKYLDTLKTDIAKNNTRLTAEEIMAALSPLQRDVVANQMAPQTELPPNQWASFNPTTGFGQTMPVVPQAQMQPMGQFGYDQKQLEMLQKLLANSSMLPSVGSSAPVAPSNYGKIGG